MLFITFLKIYDIFFRAHDQFPLAPYTDTISFKHLSPYNPRLLKRHCPRDYRNKRYRSKKLLSCGSSYIYIFLIVLDFYDITLTPKMWAIFLTLGYCGLVSFKKAYAHAAS